MVIDENLISYFTFLECIFGLKRFGSKLKFCWSSKVVDVTFSILRCFGADQSGNSLFNVLFSGRKIIILLYNICFVLNIQNSH